MRYVRAPWGALVLPDSTRSWWERSWPPFTAYQSPAPAAVSRQQWLEARLRLLAEEKKQTRARDALNASRRRLPMVRIEKDYVFEARRDR